MRIKSVFPTLQISYNRPRFYPAALFLRRFDQIHSALADSIRKHSIKRRKSAN